MVLWKKESSSANAHLVDLFVDKSQINGAKDWNRKLRSSDWKNQFLLRVIDPKKCNKASDGFRTEGNMYFKQGQWTEAMELYSQSLRFAELGTNNVSFAYANRASCFLHLKMYDECLRDIELAVQANYPHMPKLMQRKADCEAKIKGSFPKQKAPFEPKLSFNPNEKFPCMADALEIQQNEEFGRHVIAKCDIDVGQTVLVEDNFVSFASAIDRIQCYTCLQAMKNFIACSNCTDVMFCSEKCRDQNEIHQKFCGAAIHRMPNDVKFIAKSILMALIAFSSADELMDFVEDVLSKRGSEIPAAANDPKSKYGLFLNLQPAKWESFDISSAYRTFTGLLDMPFVQNMFNSEKSQRFLMHLIGEHFLIISNNSYGGLVSSQSTMGTLATVLSLFNHACAPNLFNSSTGNSEVCITMRPIKKGDQLFVKYLCGDRTTRQRQEILLKQYGFLCKCDKCEERCQPADRSRMKSDSSYKSLNAGIYYGDLSKLKHLCELFLKQYGGLPWSEEMGIVLKQYTQCLLDDFPSF